jgi:hypothetical protein
MKNDRMKIVRHILMVAFSGMAIGFCNAQYLSFDELYKKETC